MSGRRNVALVGRSGSSESLSRSGGDPRSRRSSQASQSTNIELGDNIEVDSKQRMQVIKAANVLKLSEGAGSDDIVSTVNSVIDALEGAGLMKGRGKSF